MPSQCVLRPSRLPERNHHCGRLLGPNAGLMTVWGAGRAGFVVHTSRRRRVSQGPCSRSFVGGAIQPERACVASHATRQRVSLTPASRRAFRAESSHRYRTAQERRAAAALGVCRSKSEHARAAQRHVVTSHTPRSGVRLHFAHAAQRRVSAFLFFLESNFNDRTTQTALDPRACG